MTRRGKLVAEYATSAGNAASFVATQNYVYDNLNRLKSATENIDAKYFYKFRYQYVTKS